MKEIEKKFELKNTMAVQKRLHSLGFRLEKEEKQIDIPLSPIFNEEIQAWPRIRFLPEENKTIITVKDKKFQKELEPAREEIEFTTSNLKNAIIFFEILGFPQMGKVKKRRKIYRKGNVEIAIDDVEGLGRFIEIEIKKTSEEKALQAINTIAQTLSLEKEINKGYFDLLNEGLLHDYKKILNSLAEEGKAEIPKNINATSIGNNILKVSKDKAAYYHGFKNKKISIKESIITAQ